jgi:hypothetical protein
MQLPLFVSIRPSAGFESVHVMIGKGKWGLVCSEPSVEFYAYFENDPLPISDPSLFYVSDLVRVFIRFKESSNKIVDVRVESIT